MPSHVTRLVVLAAVFVLATRCGVAAERYAFLVAVREYDKTQLNSLQFTENDVTELGRVLEAGGYRPQNIVQMTQAIGATQTRYLPLAANITREFRLLLSEVTEKDSLLIAFSGHGVQFAGEQETFFCPADAKLSDRKTLVPLGEVYRALERCKAATKVLLVDACRNNPLSTLSKSRREVDLEMVLRAPLDMPGGIAAFFSCSAGQQSFEHPDLKHGVFFNFIVRGLSGEADFDRDQEISLAELELYAVKNVQSFARRELGEVQTPERRGEARGLLTLAKIAAIEPPLPPRVPPVRPKPGQTITNSLGMKLAFIPEGEFLMGSPPSEELRQDDEAQHRVTISRPFYFGVYEVTQEEYQRVTGAKPSFFSSTGDGRDLVAGEDTRRFPVETVSWIDAVNFCNGLSRSEKLEEYYAVSGSSVRIRGGDGYRLPTEAEWEYACRAGSTTAFHFGTALNGSQANCDGENPYGTTVKGLALRRTTHVGSYQPNAWGLYDMHGNVWDWCGDWYRADYEQLGQRDPANLVDGTERVFRGGCWWNYSWFERSAVRLKYPPDYRSSHIGFHVARSFVP